MNRRCLIKHRWLPALALLCCLPGLADTVYRTVDEDGVIGFSNTQPEGDVTAETLEIDAGAPAPSEVDQQRLQAMREITERMAADRMAREKHRAELRLLQAQTQPRPEPEYEPRQQHYYQPRYQPYYNPAYPGYPPGYPGYSNYPPQRTWKHGYKPWPEHPMTRPSRHPAWQGHRPGSISRPMARVGPR